MPKTIVTFGVITKRQTAKNSVSKSNQLNESNAIDKAYRVITSKLENKQSLNGSLNLIKSNAERMLESLADSNTANKYSSYVISIIEKMNDTKEKAYVEYADQLAYKFSSNVLQYVAELDSVIENVTSYNLTEKQRNVILKEANIYATCDRIVNNFNTIKKRFNLEETVLKNKGNLRLATESVCSMIDTYNRIPYQKMNICIEEMMYIIEKNNLKCKRSDIVNTILEYFLLSSPELSDTVYNGYKKCITESCFIAEEDLPSIKYVFNKRDTDNAQCSHIKEYIDSYYIDSVKTQQSFEDTIINCMNSDILDLSYNFPYILELIVAAYKSDNLLNDTELELAMQKLEGVISSRIVNLVNNAELSQELLASMINSIIDITNEARYSEDTYPRLSMMIDHFKNIVSTVSPYFDFLYDDANIQTMNKLAEAKEVPVSEGHIFRGHNLLVAVRNLDRYLGDKCKSFVNKLIGKSKTGDQSVREKISNFLYKDEDKWLSKGLKKGKENFKNIVKDLTAILASFDYSNFNPYSYITEESQMFDMTLYRTTYSEDEISDIKESMSELCKGFNQVLESNYETDTFKTYYIINAGEASIHFTENTRFTLEEDDIIKIKESVHPDYLHCIDLLAEAEAAAELVSTINNKDLETSLFSYFSSDKDMSLNKFDTVLEALSLLEVDKSIVKKFADKYSDHLYYTITEDAQLEDQNSKIDELLSKYQPEEDVPEDIQLEAYLLFDALLESSDDDLDDDEDYEYENKNNDKSTGIQDDSTNSQSSSEHEKEETKKNPFKGINLKSIKLALLGLKRKFKQMTQKEKELSKNVDSAFKHLVDSFRKALISDSREAIIKGSVIPSFSKCLKIGIPAAIGISKGLINPGVAAIIALGSFALSKHITKKERMILLDEIETEIEVVDKEIAMAERDEDMKKYRALLQYKKNLQRQYQRIRFNAKLGRLPKADAGRPAENPGYDY